MRAEPPGQEVEPPRHPVVQTQPPAPQQTQTQAIPATAAAQDGSPQPSTQAGSSPFLWPQQASQGWSLVQTLAGKKAPLVWVSHLQLVKADANTVWLGPAPGQRDVMKFVTSQKNAREQMANLFQQVLGQAIKVEWQTVPLHTTPALTNQTVPTPAVHTNVAPLDQRQSPDPVANLAASNPQTSSSLMGDRQSAMRLPLVRQVMDLFDATIVQVRTDNAPVSQESGDSDTADPIQNPQTPGSSLPGQGMVQNFSNLEAIEDSPFQEEDEHV